MNQIVKDKMEREILVVKNSDLFKNIERRNGFYDNSHDFESIIKSNFEYMKRATAESNFDYKQPIPYAVLINDNNEIFVYKRGGKDSNAGESRLHSKISIGVGGHIEKEEENSNNPVYDTLFREIEEELGIKKENIDSVNVLGYINDDSNEVGKVHIGVAYLLKVSSDNIKFEDGEIENGEFVSLEKLSDMINSGYYNVETWTKILFPIIKNNL